MLRRGIRKGGSIVALVACGLAATARAALPPEHYQRARETAENHLQIRIDQVDLVRGPGLSNCQVRATVLRDFRGDMAAGTRLGFDLNCRAPGVRPMPGPDAWHDYGTLKQARYAEGFFRGRGQAVEPVHGQLGIVEHERASPWCEAESGRCNLPPPRPPLVLECARAAPDNEESPASVDLVVKLQDHRMWYWSDIERRTPGEDRGWRRQLFPAGRHPAPLETTPARYRHETHLFTEGGEVLLQTRRLTIDRSSLAFEDRRVFTDGRPDEVQTGVCRAAPDPDVRWPVRPH